jgi:hypothetical protein
MAKTVKNLKKSFPHRQKSAFDFDHAVAETYEMFPEANGRVFFIDVKTKKIIHPDAAIRDRMVSFIDKTAPFKELLDANISNCRKEKSSRCVRMKTDGKNKFILLYLEKDLRGPLGTAVPLAENQHFIFDHELAHAVIPKACSVRGGVRCESIADSYAALRHFQRYGTKTDTIKTLMQRRAVFSFFYQDTEHFTSQPLETVLSFKKEFNFKTLSSRNIAAMAAHIGTKDSIGKKELRSLSRCFNKLSGVLDKVKNEKPLRNFADMVLSARSPEVAKWGTIALQAFLDKKIFLATDKRRLSLHGPYWQKLRKDLKKRQKSLLKPVAA